jgi:hypothetical protein
MCINNYICFVQSKNAGSLSSIPYTLVELCWNIILTSAQK